jgi:hypothetical protein
MKQEKLESTDFPGIDRFPLGKREKKGVAVMLIGEVMEKTPSVTAAENMASRLADRVRNIWLNNEKAGITSWEENFYEDPDGVAFLRGESFPNLEGIDYIFRWWGSDDLDELAGDLQVLWKVKTEGGVELFKTTIRFANWDFVLGTIKGETKKREFTRSEFCKAFGIWQNLYVKYVTGENA